MSSNEIRMEQHVAASSSRVWEALIRPGLWWGDDVTLDPIIGGHFSEPWSDGGVGQITSGTITEMEPPHLLAMSWKDEDWNFETGVVITIAGEGDRAVILLEHGGWDAAPPDERGRLIADHRHGWSNHLKDLAACAESMRERNEGETSWT